MNKQVGSASLAIPFAVGQELWWVGGGYVEDWAQCPECVGTRAITMILGNGESMSLACAACSSGYEPPSGSVRRVTHQHKPTRFTPARVDVYGGEIRYSESSPRASSYSTVSADDLFASEADCLVRCATLNAERDAAARERDVAQLASKRRDMAFSAHYWRGQVKRLERDLEVARARLAVCPAKDRVERHHAEES